MTALQSLPSTPPMSARAGLLPAPLPGCHAIETARLQLRVPTASDEDELLATITASLPELQRWLPWCQGGYPREACREWIAVAIAAWRASREFAFLIIERNTNRLAGSMGLNRVDAIGRWANLGYWLRSDVAGQGYATEAATAVTRFGLDVLGLQRIEIFADVENHASRRVAEKIGAKFEGIARNRAPIADVNHDAAVYSLIPGDL
jgi:ribosomal-protein-serine acetyltransferase